MDIDEDYTPPSVEDRCIVITNVPWNNIPFLTAWLRAITVLQAMWELLSEDSTFLDKIHPVNAYTGIDFGYVASMLLTKMNQVKLPRGKSFDPIIVALETWDCGDAIAIMVQCRLLKKNGQTYTLSVPEEIRLLGLQNAALRVAKSMDAHYVVHPETFLDTLSTQEALDLQLRLLNSKTRKSSTKLA